jgi:hypothetical protein
MRRSENAKGTDKLRALGVRGLKISSLTWLWDPNAW